MKIAEETRSRERGKVYTLGSLIHNPQVIADLEKKGILSIDDPEQLEKGTVIIRSHGISPSIYHSLQKKKLRIIDATCPIVKKIQKLVKRLAEEKQEIIIVGNREHPEIKALIGFSEKRGIIVEKVSEAKRLPHRKKRAVIAQSTQDLYLFEKVVSALIEKTDELSIYNTICSSTQTRQKSTSALASQVDTLFIIGGKNSSNTNKLYQISKRILPKTYFIERVDQITPEMLKGAKKIGLSGGASTPPEVLHEAVMRIKTSCQHFPRREKIAP